MEESEYTQDLAVKASKLMQEKKFDDAESELKKALRMVEQLHGKGHNSAVELCLGLYMVYLETDRLADAEASLLEVLSIQERANCGTIQQPLTPAWGPALPAAATLNALFLLYRRQGRSAEAEKSLLRALDIVSSHFGQEHPTTARIIHDLAQLYDGMKRYTEAETLYVRALEVEETTLGRTHATTVETLMNLGRLFLKVGRLKEGHDMILRVLVDNSALERLRVISSVADAGGDAFAKPPGRIRSIIEPLKPLHARVPVRRGRQLRVAARCTEALARGIAQLVELGQLKEASAVAARTSDAVRSLYYFGPGTERHKKNQKGRRDAADLLRESLIVEARVAMKRGKYKEASAMYREARRGAPALFATKSSVHPPPRFCDMVLHESCETARRAPARPAWWIQHRRRTVPKTPKMRRLAPFA
jgi:tetratricopeptide (TPR) repeat protein